MKKMSLVTFFLVLIRVVMGLAPLVTIELHCQELTKSDSILSTHEPNELSIHRKAILTSSQLFYWIRI
jgi:hypothetical protein